MTALVVDSSVALAWLLPEANSNRANAIVGHILNEGAVAPEVFRSEVANGLLMAERRKRLPAETAERILELFGKLEMDVEVEAPTGAGSLARRLAVARRCGLTAYDASFLELAIRRELPLATFDNKLRRAAAAERVPLID